MPEFQYAEIPVEIRVQPCTNATTEIFLDKYGGDAEESQPGTFAAAHWPDILRSIANQLPELPNRDETPGVLYTETPHFGPEDSWRHESIILVYPHPDPEIKPKLQYPQIKMKVRIRPFLSRVTEIFFDRRGEDEDQERVLQAAHWAEILERLAKTLTLKTDCGVPDFLWTEPPQFNAQNPDHVFLKLVYRHPGVKVD